MNKMIYNNNNKPEQGMPQKDTLKRTLHWNSIVLIIMSHYINTSSIIQSFMHSFIHPFINSFMHSFIHPSIH